MTVAKCGCTASEVRPNHSSAVDEDIARLERKLAVRVLFAITRQPIIASCRRISLFIDGQSGESLPLPEAGTVQEPTELVIGPVLEVVDVAAVPFVVREELALLILTEFEIDSYDG